MTGTVRDRVVVRMRRMSRFAGPLGGALLALAGALLLVTWVPLLGGARTIGGLTRTVLWWQAWAQQIVLRLGTAFWAALAAAAVSAVLVPLWRARRSMDAPSDQASAEPSRAPSTPSGSGR